MVLAARTADALERTAAELDPSGEKVTSQVTDITDPDSCEALVAHALDRFGSVDALIQVAAYENVWGGLYDLRFEDWRKAFETNVLGALTVLRPVATAMKAGGGGSVVLIGSQSMFQPALPQSGYAASKGALLSAMYYLGRRARGRTTSGATWWCRRGCGGRPWSCRERDGGQSGGSPPRRCSRASSASSRSDG